jgi:hypothetical protein
MSLVKRFGLVLTFSFLYFCSLAQINPTGTYIIGNGLSQEETDTKGNFGEIRVKKVSPTKVAIALYVIGGAPAYDSGDFLNTLTFRSNKAVFSNSDFDKSCRIYFTFSASELVVKQTSDTILHRVGLAGTQMFQPSIEKRLEECL